MISSAAEYALRAVVYLAGHTGSASTVRTIAEATQVPPGYLSKVLQSLAKARIVTSHRGRHGGFVLARPPDQLSALDVVNAVDPVLRIRSCPLGLETHSAVLCPLHRRVDEAAALVESAFSRSRIIDLVGDPSPARTG